MLAPSRQRIESLDVARGFALLGIFLVNVEYFARPFGAVLELGTPDERGLSMALWWVVETLCEGKFYPLFSLLFGIGLALQRDRVAASGGSFARLMTRRLGSLAMVGLVHGLLLWYGDILFAYSLVGLLVCLVLGASARFLLASGALALTLAVAFAAFAGAAEGAAPPPRELQHVEIDGAPLEVLWQQLRSSDPRGPVDPYWQAAETVAYREGPWLQAQGFRALSFALLVLSMAAGGGLPVLAMFLLGAAMVRLDLLGARRAWLGRLGALGLAAGLPLAVLATQVGGPGTGAAAEAAEAACDTVAGAALAIGYLGIADLLASAARRLSAVGAAVGMLASAGRMALTNYLLQTVVATAVTYHWGLARFGTLERPERVGLVLAVFAVQLVLSRLWLSRLRFGPLEWAWRSFTYGAWQPLRSGRAATAADNIEGSRLAEGRSRPASPQEPDP